MESLKHKSKNIFTLEDPKNNSKSKIILTDEKHLRKRQIESNQKFDKIFKKRLLKTHALTQALSNPENELFIKNIEQINPVKKLLFFFICFKY
jgi:hypothetical protein